MRRRCVLWLCLLTLPLAAACAALGPVSPTPAPTAVSESLDLSGTQPGDLSYLEAYTWLKRLDLRHNDIAPADYDKLAAALPDCEILWSVPIAGARVDSGVEYLRVNSLSEADVEALGYLGALTRVNARGCTDYEALVEAAARYPDVDFLWSVRLGSLILPSNATRADISGQAVGAEDIRDALNCLPSLTELSTGDVPLSDADKRMLLEACPSVQFAWTVEVLPGLLAYSMNELLDFNEKKVDDVDALIEKLKLLPGLKEIDMSECGPSNEEMMRIRTALPEVKVVWMVDVGGYRIRTDILGFSTGVITRFPNGGGYRTGDGGHGQKNGDFDNLIYCTDIVAVDIGHCVKITDISFIAKMPKLKYLIIAMTSVSDISALATQTELIYLEIFDDYGITDITPLRNCKKLKCLNCSATNFTEIETLLSLTELERLWMTHSALTDEQLLEVRAGLPNTWINDNRDRYAADHVWRRGNWHYVDMQRIYGMRAQFQYGISPTPEITPAPEPTPEP